MNILGLIVLIFYFLSIGMHLSIYLTNRSFREHFWYILIIACFSVSIIIESFIDVNWLLRYPLLHVVGTATMVWCACATVTVFLHTIFRLHRIYRYMFWSLLFDLLLCVIGAVVFMVTKRTLFIYSLFYIPTCVFAFLFTAMVGIIFFRRQYYLDKSKLLVFIGFALSFPAVAVLMILVYTPGLYRQYAANIGFLPMLLCFEISLMSAFSLSLKKTESLKRDLYVKTGDKDRLFLERCAYFGLSDREAQITKLLIGGNDAKKIAQILGISYHTVRNIRRKIYEKTGADSIGVLINRF